MLKHLSAGMIALGFALPALAEEPSAAPPAEEASQAPTEPSPAASEPASEPPLQTIPVPQPAESPPEDLKSDAPTVLDTIEVTAQRRKQKLMDVPLAVTAITQDQIESRGITRLDDLNSLAPGLQVSRSPADTTISQLTIRGSSQINPAIYWDPSVGVYLDGAYIGKAQGSIFDIVDLAGVEVLRGPQGTLYGRNTVAGAINFITREPSGTFSGSGSVDVGTLGDKVYRASMDLPRLWIADITLGVRSERRDPWVDTTPTSIADGLNDRHSDGAHLATVLDLAEGLEALYRFDYSKTDQSSVFLQLYRSGDANLAPYLSKQRRTTADINSPSTEFADVKGHSLTLTWAAMDGLTIKTISGLRKVKWIDQLDLDGTPQDVAHSKRDTDYEQKSQDLNFSGTLGAFHYTAGAYYFADDGFTNNPIHVEIYQNGNRVPLDLDSRYGTHSKAWAGYGQVDWQPLEPLTLTAGVRYTNERKDLDRLFGFSSQGSPYTYYINDNSSLSSTNLFKANGVKYTATTPVASVAWRFTPEVNTYVRYAEGFKSGGYNGEYSDVQGTPSSNQAETNTPFRPEVQKSLEVGLKNSFLGGKALLNLAAFQNKLTDLQASIFTATGAAATVVRNAGGATVKGLEVESAFVLAEGTTARLNYAWLRSGYDDFQDVECDNATPQKNCVRGNFAANRAFVHAPHSSYNAVIDSELWHSGWGTLRAVADYVWTDAFFTYPYQLRQVDDAKQTAGDTEVPAYGLLNARLAFTGIPLGGTRLAELALWGRNILDEDAANNFIDFGASFENLTVANFVEPASYGLAATLRW